MTFVITPGAGGSPVPVGKYKATLEGVEIREGGFDGGQFRVWKFLADVAGELLPVEGISSLNNSTKTKSFEWLTAMLGHAPAVGESVDPVGRTCIVIVGHNDRGYAKVTGVEAYTAPDTVLDGIPR